MIKVELSTYAQKDLLAIEEFLIENWSVEILMEFYNKFDKAIEIIISGKVKFAAYEDTVYSKFLVTKHNTIIFKIMNETLYILRVIQNFQNPEDNYKSIIDDK